MTRSRSRPAALAFAGTIGFVACGTGSQPAGRPTPSASAATPADPTTGLRHVLVFVQATQEPALNRMIVERGLWPVMNCLTQSEAGLHFELVALYDRTSAGTVLRRGVIQPGLNGRPAAAALRQRFVNEGRTLLNQLYAENAPQFVDVLKSVFVIDRYIARTGVTPQVVYVSEMVERTGVDGCDLSGLGEGRDLAACAAILERDYGAKLRQRERMAGMRVDVVHLDLTLLARLAGPEVPSVAQVQTPVDELEAFWRDRFFGDLLKAHMTLHQPAGVVCDALGLR